MNIDIKNCLDKKILLLIFLFFILPNSGFALGFTENIRIDDTGNNVITQSGPAIAVDDLGNIYSVWTDERNGHADIYFAKSTDNGITFTANSKVNDANASASRASMALDNDGNILVVWQDSRNGNPDIYFSKSIDGGDSFSVNIRVDDTGISTSTQSAPVIGIHRGSGSIYVAWIDEREDVKHIYFAKSTNGGASFGANIRIDDINSITPDNVSMFVDDNDYIYAVWKDERDGTPDIYFSQSTDGGASFSPNIKVNDVSTISNNPSIAADAYGNIYIAWQDNRNANLDIYFASSTDTGISFSANLRVDNTGVSTSSQQAPVIKTDNDKLYIVWEDQRNNNPDIYFAQSVTNTPNFGINIRVDDTGTATSSQTKPSLAVDVLGYLYSVWSDNRKGLGDTDIYFATTIASAQEQTPAPTTLFGSSGEGKGKDARCFIATAAYGTPMAKEVIALRKFRDKYLMTNPSGKYLVNVYYKLSPPIARVIGKNEFLRSITRMALKPLINSIKSSPQRHKVHKERKI